MRAIPLRSALLRTSSEDTTMLHYGPAIIQLVETKLEGMTLSEMRCSCAIQKAVEAATERDVVLIEEADWSYLVSRLQTHKWQLATPALLELVDTVLNAPQQDPNANP